MRLLRNRIKKSDNRGLTIVELICAVAIVSLLGTVISAIMVVSASTYRRGSSETEVQQEAQLVANQISDLIIDSTSTVKFEGDTLTIANGSYTSKVRFVESEEKLYYSDSAHMDGEDAIEELMAEGVKEFSVNADHFAKHGYVQLDMKLINGTSSYPAVFTITSRNAADPGASFNPNATIKVTTLIKKWLMEPNEDKDFSGLAVASNGGGITWTVLDSTTDTTKIDDDNTHFDGTTLRVGKNEKAKSLRVVASCGGAEATINVLVRRAKEVKMTVVLSSGTNLKAGARYGLNAVVNGNAMNKINGAEYDTNYNAKTRSVEYELITNASAASKVQLSGNTVILLADLAGTDKVTIRAKALHAYGTAKDGSWANKTGLEYQELFDEYVLSSAIPVKVQQDGDDGWRRLSNLDQAKVDMNDMKAYVEEYVNSIDWRDASGNLYKFQDQIGFKYACTFKKVWEENGELQESEITDALMKGNDGFGSASINIRPAISGSMNDYEADYYVTITVTFFMVKDEDKTTANEQKLEGLTFSFSSMVMHVTAKFTSSQYLVSTAQSGWPRINAPNLYSCRKNKEIMKLDNSTVTGIPAGQVGSGGDEFTNSLRFLVEKEVVKGDGTTVWEPLYNDYIKNPTNGPIYSVSGSVVMNQNYHGWDSNPDTMYRVKVYSEMKKKVLNELGTDYVDEKDESGNTVIQAVRLFRETDGSGIYYFTMARNTNVALTPSVKSTSGDQNYGQAVIHVDAAEEVSGKFKIEFDRPLQNGSYVFEQDVQNDSTSFDFWIGFKSKADADAANIVSVKIE